MHMQEEDVSVVYEELDELVREYYASTVASEDVPPINFDWPVYCSLQHVGMLKLFIAYEGNELAGFLMYQIAPHLHHRGTLNALCDTLAVRPQHRSKGIGRALMKFAEPVLEELGVDCITHQFRTCYEDTPLFPKLGYKLIEYGYLKELK
jgi:GNAT superfamily N-acetyltransferase